MDYFTSKFGEDAPILTIIFFRWVGETTNQITTRPPTWDVLRWKGWFGSMGDRINGLLEKVAEVKNRGIETPKMMLPDVPLEVGINGL